MCVKDNVASIKFVKASDQEMSNDLHLCSTESYIYTLTEIDSWNKLSGMTLSQDELATDFFQSAKMLVTSNN